MISSLVWKATLRHLHARKHWFEWDRFTNISIEHQRTILSGRLLETLRYFGARDDAFPEWMELAARGTPEDVWQHWSSLPIVTKKDLSERFNPEETLGRLDMQGRIDASGGSTGVPTRFVWDNNALQQRAALQYYCWLKFGWKPGMPVMSLWGAPRDLGQAEHPRAKLMRRLRDVTIVDGYEFSGQTVEEAVSTIGSHKSIAVYGYTKLLEQFAREILKSGRSIPSGKVATAWSGGEPLEEDQSELFRKAFGVPIHNHYGGREFGAIGYKLDGSTSFKLFRSVLYLEIVNDQNEPCAPGETGRILLTTLNGRGTPFIRYENGDLGTYAEHDMTEAGLVGISSIDGRKTSLIYLPDGRSIHNMFWYQLFKDYGEIQSFNVHQNVDGTIDVVYIGQGFSSETSEALNRLIANMLGGVTFSIERVDQLPKTAQGKHIQVTSDYVPS